MPRPEKVQAVADIKERLEDSAAVFLAEYAGLSVSEQQELRRGLRSAGTELKVVKMTLARIAATELGHDDLVEDLSGPTALAFASGDAAAAAKVLRDFAKDHAALVLKSGLLDGEQLTPERVAQLADLDSREVLLAKLAGAFQAPMAQMAGLLAAMPRNLASMVSQVIDRLPDEAPAEEPAPVETEAEAATADDAPADEDAPEEAAAADTDDSPAAEAEDAPADEAPAETEASDESDGDEPEATTDEDAADAASDDEETAAEAEKE